MNSKLIPPASTSPNRRSFIKKVSAAALAVSFVPYIKAQDKAGTKNPILGSGEHTYECIHDWGELPSAYKYGNTHGVCEDAQGRIYIKHTVGKGSEKDDAIIVFDDKGKFVKSWGAEFKGGAHGLHLSKEDNKEFLYLCDTSRKLAVKTTLDGEVIWSLGVPDVSGLYNSSKEYTPTNIAVAPNGDFYVADGYGKSWIHQYNKKAEYIRSFGGNGKDRGQTSCPHGLMVDTRESKPTLVVADRSNHRLQYFSMEGHPIKLVTDELRAPCHFHTRGDVLLIPDLDSRVTLFDKQNKLITHLGEGDVAHYREIRSKPREAFTAGQFVAPHSAYFDHSGNIFVVEWVEVGRVTKLRKIA
ncbi:MAG: repeat containing protein [Verrucomicrobiales bacterium]|nr:repeat containing protein [Verrucomicrobiales bacterium]